MGDAISPAGTSRTGLTQTLAAAAKARPAPENPRSTQSAASAPTGTDGGAAVPAGLSPADASSQVNQYLQQAHSDLTMKVDKDTGRTVFTIVRPSGEVVLQVPSAEVLNMARKLAELTRRKSSSGALVDKQG
jgi:uncharacterized FlaG/YvyC family protein